MTTFKLTARVSGLLLALVAASSGCASNGAESSESDLAAVRWNDALTSVTIASDHTANNVRIAGSISYLDEPWTSIGVVNRSRPERRGFFMRMHTGLFDTQLRLESLAEPNDCIAIHNGGVNPMSVEEATAGKELGAFAYARMDFSGVIVPMWAVNGPKVYPDVEACLNDPLRQPVDYGKERIAEVTDVADYAVDIGGFIFNEDSPSEFLLRNATDPSQNAPENAFAMKWVMPVPMSLSMTKVMPFKARLFGVRFSPDGTTYITPANGDCMTAVSRHGDGSEVEVGAFSWCHASEARPCPTGIALYDDTAACLAAAMK